MCREGKLTIPDSQLLELAREYNSQALAEIYDRYAEAIYRYLYRYLGDAEQAEDLTSEVFVKLLQVLNTRRAPNEHLQGWLYSVARNLAMDWFRKLAKGAPLPLDEHTHLIEHSDLVMDGDAPSSVFERRQTRQRLRAAICQLTADQRQVIWLRFGEGLKIAEVSEVTGKSEGAVKVLQHRAVKRLAKLLEREGNQVHEQKRGGAIRESFATGNTARER
jgi:RNA polymerase sigma-70 factor (ECF subfamily)